MVRKENERSTEGTNNSLLLLLLPMLSPPTHRVLTDTFVAFLLSRSVPISSLDHPVQDKRTIRCAIFIHLRQRNHKTSTRSVNGSCKRASCVQSKHRENVVTRKVVERKWRGGPKNDRTTKRHLQLQPGDKTGWILQSRVPRCWNSAEIKTQRSRRNKFNNNKITEQPTEASILSL